MINATIFLQQLKEDAEFAGLKMADQKRTKTEKAGLENDGPNWRAGMQHLENDGPGYMKVGK